ncbi:hypothetical protein [Streptomyces sp. NPDC101455]|uniref:hypothetical protein n=1 Tax=Streptomyces sp. NPDC101455 TaxID=3366142 RepID=UPI003828F829
MRQPAAAALFAGLDDVAVLRCLGRSGYRRAADVLMAIQDAAHDLALLDGSAREWLAAPLKALQQRLQPTMMRMAATRASIAASPAVLGTHFGDRYEADEALDTLRHVCRSLEDALRGQDNARATWLALTQVLGDLPGPGSARTAARCTTTAEQLEEVTQRALPLRTAASPLAPRAAERLEFLTELAPECRDRFTATAGILRDAKLLGNVPLIVATAAEAVVTETAAGLSVQHQGVEIGPVLQTADGRWAAADGAQIYDSPEGAVAELVRAHQ